MGPLTAVVIGCGSVAERGLIPHLVLDESPKWVKLVAVCDEIEERAEETARRFGVAAWFTDYAEMFDSLKPDMALITTPVPSHFEIAMAAIDRGIHIYLQKPMVSSLDEADRLISAAKQAGVQLLAAPGQMLSPGLQQLKAMIAADKIGHMYWAFASTSFVGHEHESFRKVEPVDPTWYYKKPGGGPVNSMAVYSLHTLTGVLGSVKKVSAFSGIGQSQRKFLGKTVDVDMDDNTLILLDFGDARFAFVGAQFAQMGRVVNWGFTGFYGSSGALEIMDLLMDTAFPAGLTVNPQNLEEMLNLPHTDFSAESLPYMTEAHWPLPEGHVYMDVCHLADCILNSKAIVPTGEHARHVIEVIEKAYISAETGIAQTIQSVMD